MELIADNIAEFLKSRLQINQKIVYNHIEKISLNEYIDGLTKTKNDNKSIITYQEENLEKVFISDEEIEEITTLIKELLIKYSVDKIIFIGSTDPFSRFIYWILDIFDEQIVIDENISLEEKTSKLKTLKKWINYTYYDYNNGNYKFYINRKIDGEIKWDCNQFIMIGSFFNRMCEIDINGIDKMALDNIVKQDDDILLINNIYYGTVHSGNECNCSFFLYDNGKVKDLKTNKKHSLNIQKDNEEYVALDVNLDTYLKRNDLEYLIEDIYYHYQIDRVIKVCESNKYITEEKKKKH